MAQKNEIDNLDRKILQALFLDAKTPYLELARRFKVSSGTIHTRINRLKEDGVIKGTKIYVDLKKIGFDVECFIGLILKNAKDYDDVIEHLKTIDHITEIYFTSGKYHMFLKAITENIETLYEVLTRKLQRLDAIQSTETLIVFKRPLKRALKVYKKPDYPMLEV